MHFSDCDDKSLYDLCYDAYCKPYERNPYDLNYELCRDCKHLKDNATPCDFIGDKNCYHNKGIKICCCSDNLCNKGSWTNLTIFVYVISFMLFVL